MSMRRRWILLPLAVLAAMLVIVVVLFDWNWFKGPIESAASAALGRDVEIAGDLNVDLAMAPTITLEQVRIANAEWGSRPDMLTIPRLAFAIDLPQLLRGQIALRFLRVQEPDLLLEANRQGEANWQFGPPEQKPGAPRIPIIEDLEIADAAIRYHEPGGPKDVVAAFDNAKGAITASGVQLDASGTLDEQPLSLHLASAPVAQLEAEAKRFPFEFDAELGSTRLAVTGSAEAPLQAQGLSVEVALDSRDPGTLLALAGREARDLGDLHVRLSVTGQDQIWTVQQIGLRLGQTDLRGHATVQLGKPEPLIAAELASDQVRVEDLDALLPRNAAKQPSGLAPEAAVDPAIAKAEAALDESRQGAGGNGGVRLPLDMLPKIDGEVSYTVGRLSGPDLALTDLFLQARFENGLPQLELTGGGEYQKTPVALDVHLGGPERATAARAYPVQARIEAAGSKIQIDGVIGQPETLDGIDLQVEASSEGINDLIARAGIDLPPIPPFAVGGHLVQNGQVWHVRDFRGQFSESELAGDLTLDLSEQRPFIAADLRSKRLQVSDLITAGQKPAVVEVDEAAAAADAEEQDTEEPALISIEGVNFDQLPELDADVSFTGELVEVKDFRFEPLKFDLKLRDRVAVLDASGTGRYRNSPLVIEAHAGNEDSLDNPDAPYPVEIALRTKNTDLRAKGSVGRPLSFTGLDVDVALKGPDLSELGDALQLPVPATPPYNLTGKVTHQADEQRWNLVALNGTVGDSDVAGDVSLELSGERPTVVADLRSKKIDLDDLGIMVGAPTNAAPGETASEEQKQEAAAAETSPYVLPDQPFDVPDLRRIDARVKFAGESIQAKKLPLERMAVELTLEDGRLKLEPLKVRLGDGELDATMNLDSESGVLDGQFDLTLRSVNLNELFERFDIEVADIKVENEATGTGAFGGRAKLHVRGKSVHQLAASADGELAMIMDGGQINALIVEAIGLDVGEALGLLVTEGDTKTMVPLQCVVGQFAVKDGIMDTKAMVLKSSDSTITGSGQIDLGEERLALRLLAHPQDPSVLTASTPVRIEGTFKEPDIGVISEELEQKSLAALALGVVLPVIGAILPFIETGEKDHGESCGTLIRNAEQAADVPADVSSEKGQ
jgi:uncharacterized protein involved in outer membrane biogenesis